MVDPEWQMVFKAVAGISSPNPYDLWISTISDGILANYFNSTCQHPIPSDINATHCKTYNILEWEELNIEEVNYHLCKITYLALPCRLYLPLLGCYFNQYLCNMKNMNLNL